jgi:hypothetical protein
MITLKTLPMATEQEVFDQVAAHLLAQNKKSLGDAGHCRYRGCNGLKCAAGCLIGDDEYEESIEGKSWYTLQVLSDYDAGKSHWGLISQLQKIHDRFDPILWRVQLKGTCQRWGLEWKHDDTNS